MKDLFIKYLKNCTRLSEKSADNYSGGINVIDQKMRQLFPDFTSCFEYNDYDALNKFAEVLLNNPEFKKFNESSSSKNMYSGSLEWYLNFLKAMSLFSKKSMLTIEDIPFERTGSSNIIRAIRTKPFLLLAGISGTGKSRIVRQLAKACWDTATEEGRKEAESHKPSNFEMVQVKPNWHDSSELLGYVSRIGDKPEFIAGDFLKFIAKAWENPEVPYFLCLDEMNLAPVEQYFAEYLSVVESRKLQDDGEIIITDPILRKEDEKWYFTLTSKLTSNKDVREDFNKNGIRIPQNLIVIGTVNMDETTYSFSRKVLDRAMTIEMNEVDLNGGLDKSKSHLPHIKPEQLLADAVEGYDVYQEEFKDDCDTVIKYLGAVNDVLANTPFRVAYRTRNEFLIYVVNSIRLAPQEDMADSEKRNKVIAEALDEVTSMKILSRIEGDKRKVHFLGKLIDTIKTGLDSIDKEDRSEENSVSLRKLNTMTDRLDSGYTYFWD